MHFGIYLFSRGSLREMVLFRKWSIILLFYCLVFCHIGLLCRLACLYFVFIISFVTEIFERPSGGDYL